MLPVCNWKYTDTHIYSQLYAFGIFISVTDNSWKISFYKILELNCHINKKEWVKLLLWVILVTQKKKKEKRLSLLMFKWGYIWIEVSKYSVWEGSCDSLINVKQIECLEENDR